MPKRTRTWGPEACELAEAYGIAPLPWQRLVLDDMLGERPDGRWAARNSGLAVPRQNGKSVVSVVRVLAGLYVLGEELIVYTAHQVGTAKEIFRRLVETIEDNSDLRARLKKVSFARGDEAIELHSPNQRLLVKARSKESVRGFSADVILLDEAQMGLDEDDMAALGPTQRARPNPQTIYMGTPPLVAGTYWGKLRKRALGGEKRLAWHEWSPPEGYDPTDRTVWASTNPAYPDLVDEEAIEQDLLSLGDRFGCEALGAWPKERDELGWNVFTEDAWNAAQDPGTEIQGPPAFAIEVTSDLKTVYIGAAGLNAAGERHLEIVAKFPADTGRVVGWLRKRQDMWKPVAVGIDPAGPAAYLIPEVEKHYGAVVKPLGREVAAACASVYVGINGKADPGDDLDDVVVTPVRIRPHPALDAAAKAAEWRDRGDAKVFDRRGGDGPDAAPLRAVALADHCYHARPKQPSAPWAMYA